MLAVAACGDDAAVASDAAPIDATVIDATPPGPPPVCAIAIDCDGAAIPNEPKIPCALRIDDGAGATVYDQMAGIETRGRSSQAFPKKQYAVELRDADGAENPVDLFGMGRESDWVFNGAYIDRALFRNVVLYELFQRFGGTERYAAQVRYCELTLDGDWRGVYMLTERIKRDDDRVDIAADTAGDGSTFIIKQDEEGFHEMPFANGFWNLVYPNRALALPAQTAGISAYLQQWEAAVFAGGADVFDYVDLGSAVDFVLLEEFAKNNDAYFLSVHIWKDVTGPIYFAPWDLDLSFGQPLYNESTNPAGWIQYRPAMIVAMANQPVFAALLAERWGELRAGVLSNDAIFERIDFHLETIEDFIGPNFERWPIDEIQFLDDQLYPVSSHAEEVGLVRTWIEQRLAWMDANIGSYAGN